MTPEERYTLDGLMHDITSKYETLGHAINLLMYEMSDEVRKQPVLLECPLEFKHLLYNDKERLGKLAVRGYAGFIHGRHHFWAECLCGRWTRVRLDNLIAKRTRSCGKCGRFRTPKTKVELPPPLEPQQIPSVSTDCKLEAVAKPRGFAELFEMQDKAVTTYNSSASYKVEYEEEV